MPNYSGFSLVEYFDELEFKIIFTTAYEEYANKAFVKGASGYLLKPIDIDDLNSTVKRVREEIQKEQQNYNIHDNKSIVLNLKSSILTLPFVGGIIKLNLDEILYFEAKGRQVMIHLLDNSTLLANISLKSIQDILLRTTFLRIHKSYVVNFMHIKKYTKGKDCSITLYNDSSLEVGKVFRDNITEVISYLPK
jgi:two-component system LytT family response regulator